jgi:ABC-type sugar transport system ATPase subunit
MDVAVANIDKAFGRVRVLENVTLTFPSRKFVTLLGPSGCGKTTLLRIIAGLEIVDRGSIRFGDRVVNRVAPKDRNIAMVFQSYALYPQMTIRQNIGYGLKVRGVDRASINAAVERVARILEIDALLDRRPAQLSGGQRQRVALGRAMVRSPDIFLMDEPLSNLDAKLRVTMRSELRRFHLDLQATTIYVTHDQLEAMTMSDYIAVMNAGVVQQFGTPADVYNKPSNLFVAGFIGNPPMNFLEGRLETNGANVAFRMPDFVLPLGDDGAGSDSEREVILGVRPQDVHIADPDSGIVLPGTVWMTELVGSEKLIEIDLGERRRMTVQVRADMPVPASGPIGIRFDARRLHVFDRTSGLAICA